MKTSVVKSLKLVIVFMFLHALIAPGAWSAPTPINVYPSSPAVQSAIPAGKSIPWSELGAAAGKKYSGEALSVIVTESGARLRTDFQRLRGEVTEQGLALQSTVADQPSKRFALRADSLGRKGRNSLALPRHGRVETRKGLARWLRPQVTEEYSVSVDGVRQDFMISERPAGNGSLYLDLALSGVKAESANYGALLTLDGSGRKLAYSRLKAWDALGRELPSRMAASGPDRLTLVVEDAGAVWPVRIDPTISDANWVGMDGASGLNSDVRALAFDGSGNLYAGGDFNHTADGSVSLNYIAKWNGTVWFPLGSGLNFNVYALVFDKASSTLYAGGIDPASGALPTSYIAKWDGSAWSSLGPGLNNGVLALAFDTTSGILYAGGYFDNTSDKSVPVSNIAKWDGSVWSSLGPGLDSSVSALAIDKASSTLYVGGTFGGTNETVPVPASAIAKWNIGSSTWSSLGSGITGGVSALAIDNSGTLYAGGSFTEPAINIAKWTGGTWSSIGITDMDLSVAALAIDGSNNLFAGGFFTTINTAPVNYIAKWDGSAWSNLGSGVSGGSSTNVDALAFDGSGNFYAGGEFTTAGGKGSAYLAKAILNAAPATHFTVTAPATATAGAAFNFTVTALDQFNNTATGYAGTVHFTSNDAAAAFPADATLTNGTGTFSATLNTTGSQTITATDTVTVSITGTSGNITVSATPATHFAVSAPASATAGSAFNFTVTALDQFNNTATGYAGTVHFTSGDGASVLPANVTLTNGVGTFSATLKTTGSQTITATDVVTVSITGTSGNIAVSATPATHFAVSVPATATAGSAFNFTVTALDQFNNTATGYAGTVHFTSSDAASVLPANATLTNGTGSFSATLNTTGSRTITAADTVTVSITGTSNVDVINSQTPTGDINGDGQVTIGDALLALRVAVGLAPMDNKYLTNGDVAPFVNGKPAPDGQITIADALIILRKSVGLINW